MEYPFITLDNGTQISHSEMLADRSVLVYIRKDAFHRAVLVLPAQEWREVIGFKTLYGDLTDKNNPYKGGGDLFEFPSRDGVPTSFAMGKTPYMELNVGIHNIFKFIRVDYVRRLNYLGLPNVKKNGVRFVLQFDF